MAHQRLESRIPVQEGNLLERVDETCDICVANIIADIICSFAAPLKSISVPADCSSAPASSWSGRRKSGPCLLDAGYGSWKAEHGGMDRLLCQEAGLMHRFYAESRHGRKLARSVSGGCPSRPAGAAAARKTGGTDLCRRARYPAVLREARILERFELGRFPPRSLPCGSPCFRGCPKGIRWNGSSRNPWRSASSGSFRS